MNRRLSILCVTQGEPHAFPFLVRMDLLARACSAELVLCLDGAGAQEMNSLIKYPTSAKLHPVWSKGYIESVLDAAVEQCSGDYVLRLDDDEAVSREMSWWLTSQSYVEDTHWKFPRMHLWQDTEHFLDDAQLWPDHQTRLSIKAFSGGRHTIHAPSPHGGGALAPCYIEHHKFLVKSVQQRRKIAQQWHSGDMLAFSVPEEARKELNVRPVEQVSL